MISIRNMFSHCTNFDQSLVNWKLDSVKETEDLNPFYITAMSESNKPAILRKKN
jgi:hypothetical protein